VDSGSWQERSVHTTCGSRSRLCQITGALPLLDLARCPTGGRARYLINDAVNETFEEGAFLWFLRVESRGCTVTGDMLIEKAKELALRPER
jgi:hypothetical protein